MSRNISGKLSLYPETKGEKVISPAETPRDLGRFRREDLFSKGRGGGESLARNHG
jgi:hypothetical protein